MLLVNYNNNISPKVPQEFLFGLNSLPGFLLDTLI